MRHKIVNYPAFTVLRLKGSCIIVNTDKYPSDARGLIGKAFRDQNYSFLFINISAWPTYTRDKTQSNCTFFDIDDYKYLFKGTDLNREGKTSHLSKSTQQEKT